MNPLRTRSDLQRLATDLVRPVLPHFSAGRAQVRLGANRAHYGDPAGWLEGFARPLWGLAPLAAGGGNFDAWALWREGIKAGTDPKNPEYWGLAGDYDQRSVEQAAFGFSLALVPEQVWEPLTPETKANLAQWLRHINDVKLVQSNWLYFRILVNLGLARVGESFSEVQMDRDWEMLERFYLRDGWYADGAGGPPYRDGRQGDYYVPMAFHFYNLVATRIAPSANPAHMARLVERARLFADEFQHYFAADGAALPFGRSLTYRFAQGAFWGALAYAGVEALPWGVIKGLYLRHLRWWQNKPIFTDTGVLSIGYAYPNLIVAESYNSPGSPLWALKALLPLALPESHPFWRAEELPLPRRPAVRTSVGAKLILTTDPASRDVTAINPGQPVLDWPRHAPQKYSKTGYSTRLGFTVPVSGAASPAEGGLDSGYSLSDDGRFFRVREQCFDAEVAEGVAYSRWTPWTGVQLETWVLAEPRGQVRLARLLTDRPLWSIDAGFAVPWVEKASRQFDTGRSGVASIRSPFGASLVRDLVGQRSAECVDVGANSHLMESLSALPFLKAKHEPGEHWLLSWVGGSAAMEDGFPEAELYTIVRNHDDVRVLRAGELWWENSGGHCGTSTSARKQALAVVV